MGRAAAGSGRPDADERLVDLVLEAAACRRPETWRETVVSTADGTVAELPVPAEELGRVHFVGIGGAGMSGIARIMLARGLPCRGSDAKDSAALTALRALGARVHVGHDAGERRRRRHRRGLHRDPREQPRAGRGAPPRAAGAARAAALAAVMVGRRGVAVAGTHGKTTTTSMLTVALQHCGADPSFAIGGNLNESGANAHDGSGDVFVAEADESDGSFLLLLADAAVVTNVEADHLDHYGTAEAVEEAFDAFADGSSRAASWSSAPTTRARRRLAASAREAGIDVRTYGVDAERRPAAGRPGRPAATAARSRPCCCGRRVGAGRAAAARPAQRAQRRRRAARSASGSASRRASCSTGWPASPAPGAGSSSRARVGGVRVYDDYAHHPTELTAVLRAAREVRRRRPGGRRLPAAPATAGPQAFAAEFGAALGLADEVVVMDVYAAREDPVPGVTGAIVAAAVPLPPGQVVFEPSWSAVAPASWPRGPGPATWCSPSAPAT